MAAIDVIEQVIVDEFIGVIRRDEAIARIRSVVDVTEAGAVDLLDHPAAPRRRYEQSLHPRGA